MSFTYEERDVLMAELAEARGRADDLSARASEFYEALIAAQARITELEADQRRVSFDRLRECEARMDLEARVAELEAELAGVASLGTVQTIRHWKKETLRARAESADWRRSTQELREEMEQWDFDAELSTARFKLAAALDLVEVYRRERDEAEARLAAVIALCDSPCDDSELRRVVRAAATGDTT